jgi:hypothetical protein
VSSTGVLDAADVREVTGQRVGQWMLETSHQEMAAIGEMGRQEGDAVAASLQPGLSLPIGKTFEAIEEKVGIELVQHSQRNHTSVHDVSRQANPALDDRYQSSRTSWARPPA